MTLHDPTQPSMYCRKCDYQLTGLSENRCPECGRPFDPGKPGTYYHTRYHRILRRWFRRLAYLTLLVALLLAAFLGWLYWGWSHEQATIAAIRHVGGQVETFPSAAFSIPMAIFNLGKSHPNLVQRTGLEWARQQMLGCRWVNRVCKVSLHGPQATVREFASLPKFKYLNSVSVCNIPITDDDLVYLKAFPLVNLRLANTGISNTGLARLRDLPVLMQLDLEGLPLTDEGAKNLRALPACGWLTLVNCGVTDDHVAVLSLSPGLHFYLSIQEACITSQSLASIARFATLQSLVLRRTQITDDGLAHLKSLSMLKELRLSECPITNAGLAHVGSLFSLRRLSLDGTQVTDTGLTTLQNLAALEILDLSNTQVSDKGLEPLKSLSRLRQLVLKRTHVSQDGIRALRQINPVRRIDLDP